MSNDNTVPSTSSGDDGNIGADVESVNFDDLQVPMGPMAAALGILEEDEGLPDSNEVPHPSDDEGDDEPEDDTLSEDENNEDEDNTSDEYEDEDDEESTQEAELPDEGEIDWEYRVPVKIDGEVHHLTLEELRKGYATDQSLSKKGEQIGEQRKELDTEYNSRIKEVQEVAAVLNEQLTTAETAFAKEYHEIDKSIKEARDNGDTYELSELKDKREAVQEKYWEARNKREQLAEGVQKKQESDLNNHYRGLLTKFNNEIQDLVPDYKADSIKEFAIAEGIPEDLLGQIFDARVVKFIDDYRQLKERSSKGAVKRKRAPKAKSIPTKKAPSKAAKKTRKQGELNSRVLSGQGSDQDQLDFIKSLSNFK